MQSIDTKFEIRLGTTNDIDGVVKIDDELGGMHPNLGEKVKKMLKDDQSAFLVATFEDKIVGYAGGVVRDTEFGEGDPVAYITHVGLSKEFKSKGMGRMLGDQLVTKLLEKADIIRTIVGFNRNDLQSFFNHIGFERTDLLVYQYKE